MDGMRILYDPKKAFEPLVEAIDNHDKVLFIGKTLMPKKQ